MTKSRPRQTAIVRRLKGRKRSRARIGLRVTLLFAAIAVIAMAMDMCAFPLSRRNVVLAETCTPERAYARRERAEGHAAKTLTPVENAMPCQ
jgi:hypothetical protein